MKYPGLSIIIDHLEKLDPKYFDMDHDCGTACCIGGHAINLLKNKLIRETSIVSALSNLCNLPVKIADQICWPPSDNDLAIERDFSFYYSTKDQAIKVLKHCQNTGIVDWSILLEKE